MHTYPKGDKLRTAARALNWLWLAVTAPWLALACRELIRELAVPGQADDPPNHVGILAVISVVLPVWLPCLGAVAILSVYLAWKGNRITRFRIAAWSVLAFGFLWLGPSRASFPSLAEVYAVDVAWLGALAVLPLIWILCALCCDDE